MTHSEFSEIAALDADNVMQTYGRLPVAFVRGEGTYLWDSEGKRYLDFLSGLAVTSLGHAHPEVADAIGDQARTLLHVSNLYYNDVQPRVAERLNALLGGGGRVFFANSGAEANECAIKLARRYGQANGGRDRYHVISAYGSFHGRTLTTLAATGQPQKQETFQPLPSGFRQVAFDDLDALEGALDDRVAAVMLEAVQGEGGVVPASPEYLRGVRRLCDEREALLIIDEVQCGLGRTGTWFGVRARRHPARHRDDGQGARQRRSDRSLLGPGRGCCRVPARRPRHDLRRPTARGACRARDARGHGARGRSRSLGPRRALGFRRACRRSTASPTYAVPASSSRPSLRPGSTRRSSRNAASTPGSCSTR